MVSSLTAKHDLDPASDVSASQHGSCQSPTHAPANNNEQDVITVDLLEFEDAVQEEVPGDACKGYTLDLPVGKSPYS